MCGICSLCIVFVLYMYLFMNHKLLKTKKMVIDQIDQTKIPSVHYDHSIINDNTGNNQSVECSFHCLSSHKQCSRSSVNVTNSAVKSVSHPHCSPVTSNAVCNRFSLLAGTHCLDGTIQVSCSSDICTTKSPIWPH